MCKKSAPTFQSSRKTYNMRRRTSCPNSVGICPRVLPAVEAPLHVIVKIPRGRLYQSAVIGIVAPLAGVMGNFGLSPANDNTAIRSGNQVVIIPGIETQCVRAVQLGFRWIGHHNPTTNPSYRDNLVFVLGCDGRRICITGENNQFCSN